MSEPTNVIPTTEVPPVEVYHTTVNPDTGNSLDLALGKVEKGKTKGTQYLTVHPNQGPEKVIAYFGLQKLWEDFLCQRVNTFCLKITKLAQTAEETIDLSKWCVFFNKLSPRGESKAALTNRMLELVVQLTSLDLAKDTLKVAEIIQQIQAIKADLDAKNAPDDEDEDEEGNSTPVNA